MVYITVSVFVKATKDVSLGATMSFQPIDPDCPLSCHIFCLLFIIYVFHIGNAKLYRCQKATLNKIRLIRKVYTNKALEITILLYQI